MAGRLNDKVAIVTGSTQGIGRAIVRLFLDEGAQVVFNSHQDDAAAAALRAELAGRPALFVQADVSDPEAMQRLADTCEANFGRVDVLVNNAGFNAFHDPLEITVDQWRRCFAVDLEGAWSASRAVLPGMLARQAGSIVNIVSVHGHRIIPGKFPYPVAKHGLLGLTRALGIEYAAQGIRVNSISPGLVMTEAVQAWLAGLDDPQAEYERQAALLPCKRIGRPEEVAYTALFLASDEAKFINAADIVIDGGRSQIYHD